MGIVLIIGTLRSSKMILVSDQWWALQTVKAVTSMVGLIDTIPFS